MADASGYDRRVARRPSKPIEELLPHLANQIPPDQQLDPAHPMNRTQLVVEDGHREARELPRAEARHRRAVQVLRALLGGLERWSTKSDNPGERALLASTILCAEAADAEWARLSGQGLQDAHHHAVEAVLDWAHRPYPTSATLATGGLGLSASSTPRQRALAAVPVRDALARHDGGFAQLDRDLILGALRDWPTARAAVTGRPPKGATRSRDSIVMELLASVGFTSTNETSAKRRARGARSKAKPGGR